MFHGEAPGGGLLVVIAIFHRSHVLAIAQGEQSENGFAGFDRQFEPANRVMEAFAGSSALDAAAWPVIEMMDAGLQLHCELGGGRFPLERAPIQSFFEIADALFHGAIVTGISRWIVERQHPIMGQHLINFAAVEGRTVVTLEEQRRAMLFESGFEEGGDLRAIFDRADEGIHAIA